jgi:hypothetical protein
LPNRPSAASKNTHRQRPGWSGRSQGYAALISPRASPGRRLHTIRSTAHHNTARTHTHTPQQSTQQNTAHSTQHNSSRGSSPTAANSLALAIATNHRRRRRQRTTASPSPSSFSPSSSFSRHQTSDIGQTAAIASPAALQEHFCCHTLPNSSSRRTCRLSVVSLW